MQQIEKEALTLGGAVLVVCTHSSLGGAVIVVCTN